jgi:phosphoglycerate dehydrogenase-like enzyme
MHVQGDTVASSAESSETDKPRMKVIVNIQAEVLDIDVAKHSANAWLLENVGNLLSATTSELVLGERLFWRFDVILGLPNLAQPGSGALYRIGQIVLDAVTGEIQNGSELAAELVAQSRELR